MADQILVVKRNGVKEPFSEEKVLASIRRVGLSRDLEPLVLEHVKSRLRPEIPTSEIFSHITEFLQGKDVKASVRYNLKQAIFDLGPTGFPFERYIERIFRDMGYETQVDILIQGECVTHEIDVLLKKDNVTEIVEAKFHNLPEIKSDLHVALYVYARFLDLKPAQNIQSAWIVTNTKLSEEAIHYCMCKGIRLISWNHPAKGNLRDFVENPHMYPITILPDLSHDEKQKLIEKNIVLCCDLVETKADDEKLSEVDRVHLEKAREKAKLICE